MFYFISLKCNVYFTQVSKLWVRKVPTSFTVLGLGELVTIHLIHIIL